jgi:hypothetical protein
MEVPRTVRRHAHGDSKGLTNLVQRELDRLDWVARHTADVNVGSHQALSPLFDTKLCKSVNNYQAKHSFSHDQPYLAG